VGLKLHLLAQKEGWVVQAKSNQGGIETAAWGEESASFGSAKSNQGGIETKHRVQQ
jgi:hypothetical protein